MLLRGGRALRYGANKRQGDPNATPHLGYLHVSGFACKGHLMLISALIKGDSKLRLGILCNRYVKSQRLGRDAGTEADAASEHLYWQRNRARRGFALPAW